MSTPTTVLGALVNIWESDPTLPTLFPPQANTFAGLWVGQTPEQLTPPVACLLHHGEKPEWAFEASYTETTDVSFVLFVEGLAALETAVAAIKTAFDWVELPLTDVPTVRLERTNCLIQSDQRATDVGLVFRADVSYSAQIMKELP